MWIWVISNPIFHWPWKSNDIKWVTLVSDSVVIIQQLTKKKQNKSGVDCQRSLFQAKRLKSTQSFSVARGQLGDPSRKPRRRRLRGVTTKVLNAFPRDQLFQDILTLLQDARSMQAAKRKVRGNTCHFGEEHKVWTYKNLHSVTSHCRALGCVMVHYITVYDVFY